MGYDGKLLARAREKLDIIRAENAAEHRRRRDAVYARVPEIAEIDRALRRQMTELVGITIAGGADMDEKLSALQEKNLGLQEKRTGLLIKNGYGAAFLDEIFSCQICRDTGYDRAKVCSCLKALYNRELTEELGVLMKTGDECFNKFDLGYYDSLPGEDGESPRATMKRVFDICKNYAAGFSHDSPNLLFQGGTGLGKTYLSACIAREVSDAGFSVCYDTASSALDAFENQKFSRDPAQAEDSAVKVRRMLSCDLMILDDLGTEMTTQISQSALYTLINTRLVNHRVTIISTNCSDAELHRRYSQQINSRLDGEFFKLPFVGRDIRLIKKEREY